jgi:F0F1-type ATP synthase membrane subunit b/b'
MMKKLLYLLLITFALSLFAPALEAAVSHSKASINEPVKTAKKHKKHAKKAHKRHHKKHKQSQ